MDKREIILNELKDISPAVAAIGNSNVYTAPEGYFQSLSDEVLINISLSRFPAAMPYTIPEGYFDNLPFRVLLHTKGELVSGISFSEKNVPLYSVPDGYFNSLAEDILKKAKTAGKNEVREELESISPLVNSISRENVFSLPYSYFETLNPVVKAAGSYETGKVVKMGSGYRNLIRYAAAACAAAIIFTGAYLFFSAPADNGGGMAGINKTENVDVDKSIAALSDDEISNYLVREVNNSIFDNSGMENYDPDIDNLLESASDEELQRYLDENPELPELHS